MKPNGNLFETDNVIHTEELFEEILQTGKFYIERIVSYGQITPDGEWYDQEQDEWVLLLKGEAGIELENKGAIKLKPGDYLNLPAHLRHRVAYTLPEAETIWLAVHYKVNNL